MATATTRRTFAEFLAANPTPERTIPNGRIECERCMGSGEVVNGFTGYAPNQERCPGCDGLGYVVDMDRVLEAAVLAASYEAADEVHYEYERAHAGHPDIEANPALTELPF